MARIVIVGGNGHIGSFFRDCHFAGADDLAIDIAQQLSSDGICC